MQKTLYNEEGEPNIEQGNSILSLHEQFMIQKYGPDWKTNEDFIKKQRRKQ